MVRKFKTATAAGTFDHFHKGHEQFLKVAFALADSIYIGITSDEFGKAKRQMSNLAPFEDRKSDVELFLKKHGLLKRAHIVELHDIYGPTLEPDCPIETIIVTGKTRYGAELINKLRKQKGLPTLAIEEIPYVRAEDDGELSSSRIRQGEMDREGKLYIKKEWLEKTLQLTDELRTLLRRPIGKLIKGSEENLSEAVSVIKTKIKKEKPTIVVTVGDVVAKSFNEGNVPMDIAVVDFQVKRVETFKNLSEIGFTKKEPDATVKNAKGTLTAKTFQSVQAAMRHLGGGRMDSPEVEGVKKTPYVIRVIGEEDLATLAAVLAAPLDTHVFYGQPNEGIVQVVVTEDKKAKIRNIVSQFT